MVAKDKDFKVLFFVGIGGVSMSALARLAVSEGCAVFGSDISKNHFCAELEKLGVRIFYGHSENNLKVVPDMVVYSAAIKEDNPELREARALGIPVVSRSRFLGEISKKYESVIAVSGMHGKTTTTAMIAAILMSRCDPTVHIGGDFGALGGNLRIGAKQHFVTEACEYADSFLKLCPTHAVITNIEKEHMDYFKTMAHVKKSFSTFANKAEVCYINEEYSNLIVSANKKTFGIDCGELRATNLTHNRGRFMFDIERDGAVLGKVKLRCAGRHNVLNALAAAFVCLDLGVPMSLISKALFEFENVARRFERIGEAGTNTIVHDYAHHPTEIKNAIKTARQAYGLPVVCVFQPHTFSRTKTLFKSFLRCFDDAASLYIIDTYPAREPYDFEGSAEKLCEALKLCRDKDKQPLRVSEIYGTFDRNRFDTKELFKNHQNCVILFLGAGDIEELAHKCAY